jgi:hypothetical protein
MLERFLKGFTVLNKKDENNTSCCVTEKAVFQLFGGALAIGKRTARHILWPLLQDWET